MTAEVIALFPVGEHADDTIRRTVDALVKGKGLSPAQVAEDAGMSRSTFFHKMAGKGASQAFKAGEVASLARVLGVSVAQLFDGLGGTFVPTPPDGGRSMYTEGYANRTAA